MNKFLSILLLFVSLVSLSQNNHDEEFIKYYYPNGKLSAEGYIRDGKPDGYWKNYYEDGKLKSEGNRRYFELDSIWNFYYPNGQLSNSIYYRKDKKNGYSYDYKFYFDEDSVQHHYLYSKELYINGLREGNS